MFPKLTKNRIILWAIGLILGVALAFGYRAISPIPYKVNFGWPPVVPVGQPKVQLYESRVTLEIVSRGATIVSPTVLQKQGEYYTSRLISSPFLLWLSDQLAANAPQYRHSPEELAQMIKIRFGDSRSQAPSVQLRVRSPSAEEAFYLANMIPGTFQTFLITEERNMDQQTYKNNVKEMETVRASLMEAQKTLANQRLNIDTTGVSVDPAYLSAEARVNALTRKLNELAASIANIAAQDPNERGADKATSELNQAVADLTVSRKELTSMRVSTENSGPGFDPSYVAAEARVSGLSGMVNQLSETLAAQVAQGSIEKYNETALRLNQTINALVVARKELANLKAKKDAAGPSLDATQIVAQARTSALERKVNELAAALISAAPQGSRDKNFNESMTQLNRVADSLVQAKKELVVLRAKTEASAVEMNGAYNETSDKVKTLQNRFQTLSNSVQQSFDDETALLNRLPQIVIDEPTDPAVLPPDKISKRNSLLLGAILGLAGTWVLLNFRTITRQIASLNSPPQETGGQKPVVEPSKNEGTRLSDVAVAPERAGKA